MPLCWYLEECPFAAECSKAAWDRTRHCASWESESHCRSLLKAHLGKSSLHWHRPAEEIDDACLQADITCADLPEEEQQLQQQQQRPSKRSRGSGSGSAEHPAAVIKEQQLQQQQHQLVAATRVDEEMVTVPKVVFKSIVDCLDRAVMATQHAVKLSAAARSAFEEEATKMQDCSRDAHRWLNKF